MLLPMFLPPILLAIPNWTFHRYSVYLISTVKNSQFTDCRVLKLWNVWSGILGSWLINLILKVFCEFAVLPDRPFHKFYSHKIRRSANFIKFTNTFRRIIKLQNCERVGRVLAKVPMNMIISQCASSPSKICQLGVWRKNNATCALPFEMIIDKIYVDLRVRGPMFWPTVAFT